MEWCFNCCGLQHTALKPTSIHLKENHIVNDENKEITNTFKEIDNTEGIFEPQENLEKENCKILESTKNKFEVIHRKEEPRFNCHSESSSNYSEYIQVIKTEIKEVALAGIITKESSHGEPKRNFKIEIPDDVDNSSGNYGLLFNMNITSKNQSLF